MSKRKNDELKKNPAMPKTDVEFAKSGLERVVLQAEETRNKEK
jgi:hypothetical protein